MTRHAHPTTLLRRLYDRIWRHQTPARHAVIPSLDWGWLNNYRTTPDIRDPERNSHGKR